MSLLSRFSRIAIAAILWTTTALADLPQELQTVVLEGNLYGRSSLDFRTKIKSNITSVVNEGSTGTVLEVRQLKRTKSYGVRIRIDSVGKNKNSSTAKVNDEVWVYYSDSDPWLSFKDKAGTEVEDPEEGLVALAKRDGKALPAEGTVKSPSLPTKQEVKKEVAKAIAKEENERKEKSPRDSQKTKSATSEDPNLAMRKDRTQTEGGYDAICTDCSDKRKPKDKKNVEDIGDVAHAIEDGKSGNDADNDSGNPWANDQEISKYSNSEKVAKLIKIAKLNAHRSKKLCYRYIKKDLVAADFVNSYPGGSRAKQAVENLKDQGMVNLLENPKYKDKIKSPKDAPKGAVLVYSTGEKKEGGHIEIKSENGDKGLYLSDYKSDHDIQQTTKGRLKAKLGKPYQLLGVMILPPEKL